MKEQKFRVLLSECSTIIHLCGLDVQKKKKKEKKIEEIKISSPKLSSASVARNRT